MSQDDFLAEHNVAGLSILKLVSRGNAIVAEMLRLSDYLPKVFVEGMSPPPTNTKNKKKKAKKGSTKAPPKSKYADLIYDFVYLRQSEVIDTKIDADLRLLELDEEFREEHMELLERYYMLFESIYKYILDLQQWLEDLEEGVFIQQTLEIVLDNEDGRQLLSEAIYLYGTMLLLMDERIPGYARERILMSYLRYKGPTELPLIDHVCKLCGNTGYIPSHNFRPEDYPIKLFSRFPVDANVVEMVVGRLRSDDIYNQRLCFPLPDHRSTALAHQGSQLYVMLWFVPHILKKGFAPMREIVDKHFSDNWIVPYYLGNNVDISYVWKPFSAAAAALNNTMALENVIDVRDRRFKELSVLIKECQKHLMEGVLNNEYVLDHGQGILNCLRRCNVTIRWSILHTSTKSMHWQAVSDAFKPDSLLKLLLLTSQLEYELRIIYQGLLDTKTDRWEKQKGEGVGRMKDLSLYFSGDMALTRVKKNENLQKWFMDISERIDELDFVDSTSAGRKIQQLVQALEEVEEFHQIEGSLQVKAFLGDTRTCLHNMLRIVNIREQYLVLMDSVADMSYCWPYLINAYIPIMQERIKLDPSWVLSLRSLFLKLTSILGLCLLRINQAESPDLVSVSQYYSSELVSFVRKVIAVVPQEMFRILAKVIDVQTNELQALPTKVERERLRDFAQLELRAKLAEATYKISVFTEGILDMETTLIGVIEVNPRNLLEEGIRRELVLRIASIMDKVLVFQYDIGALLSNPSLANKKGSEVQFIEFEQRLRLLGDKLEGFRRSFQYAQDYMTIHGLKIWQEEFSRIVMYNIEQECNSFLRNKVFDHQSTYQSTTIPIPRFSPVDSSVNFIGRLANALLNHTDARYTVFLESMAAWYSHEGRELVGIRTFDRLLRSVGVDGLAGLDRLLCFKIVKDLQTFLAKVRRELTATKTKDLGKELAKVQERLMPTSTLPKQSEAIWGAGTKALEGLMASFLAIATKIGHMQLLRRQIAHTLRFSAKLDSNMLYCALDVINEGVMSDVRNHYRDPDHHPYPPQDNPLLFELSKYIETSGFHDPFIKIYITTQPVPCFALMMFLFVVAQLPRFNYNESLKVLVSLQGTKKERTSIDGTPFVVGVLSILKQFHSSDTQQFLSFLGQYVRARVNISMGESANPKKKSKSVADVREAYPLDIANAIIFLELFCQFGHLSRKHVEAYLPSYIFDHRTL